MGRVDRCDFRPDLNISMALKQVGQGEGIQGATGKAEIESIDDMDGLLHY